MSQSKYPAVWNDIYDGELLRSGDEKKAIQLADRLEELLKQGKLHERQAWLRGLGRHLKSWWGAYFIPPLVAGFILGLILVIPDSTKHWAGISKHDAPYYGERHVVSWYRTHYPSSGAKQFDTGLYLETIFRVKRGPVQFWSARYSSESLGKFCVLFTDYEWYLTRCHVEGAKR